MSPRVYQSHRRAEAQAATSLRILEATIALHAEKGCLTTSYADIAARADVAIPTVYKHFPDLDTLVRGCTRHAAGSAPHLGPEIFEGLSSVPERIAALVEAVYKVHAYFAPWKRWGEAGHLDALKEMSEWERKELRALIRLCFAPSGSMPPDFVALTEALLGFATWSVLKRDPKVSPTKAARRALATLWKAHTQEVP